MVTVGGITLTAVMIVAVTVIVIAAVAIGTMAVGLRLASAPQSLVRPLLMRTAAGATGAMDIVIATKSTQA